MSAFLSDPRLAALFMAVEYAYGARVDGDFIEFGVQSGYSAQALASGMLHHPKFMEIEHEPHAKKALWLCDSFLGFPPSRVEIDAGSPMLKNGVWDEGMSRGCTEAVLRQGIATHLAPDQYRIVPGWFKDTSGVFAASDRRYSLVHADCDLYASTLDALAPLLGKGCLSPGCIVLMDDWNGNHAAREYGQRRAWAYLTEMYGIDYSDEGSYGAYSHKFIVHSYREAS